MPPDADPTVRLVREQAEEYDRASQRHQAEPLAGLDRTGGVVEREGPNLGRVVDRAARLLGLGHHHREEALRRFDERVAGLGGELAEAQQRLTDLIERQRGAPDRDAQRLSDWHLGGRSGPRPDLEEGALVGEIRAAESERDGLQLAVDAVLAEKAAWVERNRDKLTGDAAKVTAEAQRGYLAAIEALEQARDQLVSARLDQLWATFFPAEVAGRQPQRMQSLARGLTARLRRATGGTTSINAPELGLLLREDADALATAIDPEQAALLQARGGGQPAGGALWHDSDAGRDAKSNAMREAAERDAREMAAASRRYRQSLGLPPEGEPAPDAPVQNEWEPA